jgi:hypothetical protein
MTVLAEAFTTGAFEPQCRGVEKRDRNGTEHQSHGVIAVPGGVHGFDALPVEQLGQPFLVDSETGGSRSGPRSLTRSQ